MTSQTAHHPKPAERSSCRELDLDAELPAAVPALTAERARAVARLLARVHGVDVVSVAPHCAGRFLGRLPAQRGRRRRAALLIATS